MTVAPFAVGTSLCLKDPIVAELNQSVVTKGGFHVNVPSATAIAAARTSPGNRFFPAKGKTTVASVAPAHVNFGLIQKHGSSKNKILYPRTVIP
jgi:hypothetical protein